MRNRKLIIKVILLLISLLIIFCTNFTFAHSGRTDSYGGHKDNKNVSGLGSYHYHCGGYPAHLHTSGVCPYSTSNKNSNTANTNTESSNTKTNTSTKKIEATNISIKGDIYGKLKVGQKSILNAKIEPDNASDKAVTWNTNDKNIVKVDSKGNIEAISVGTATITASTSNGKKDVYNINVIQDEILPETIILSKRSIILKENEQTQISVTMLPMDVTDNSLEWSSSDENIVKIDNGKIVANNPGIATITVKTVNGLNKTCEVTVKENIEENTANMVVGAFAGIGAPVFIASIIKKRKK